MEENKSIDFNLVADDCLIATGVDSGYIIEKLANLKTVYSDIELIAMFNYFLKIEYQPDVLIYLIRELDKYRDSSSLEPLTNLLLMKNGTPSPYLTKEQYSTVRTLCAKAISNLKDHRSVHTFLYCLNNKDENYKVRLSCADALGRLGDKYAVTSLMDVVSDEDEKSVYIRESAAVALGLIGDVRAVDSLVSVLEAKDGIMDKFTYLKEKVVEAICRLSPNNNRTLNALKKSLKDENPQVRINSIEALMDSDFSESSELIAKMLFDNDEEVQRNAVIALYNIQGEVVLREILRNPEYSKICKEEAQSIIESEKLDECE